jgi:peptidoglycan/LPS O-acetylase OafA/YrhL
LNDEVLRPKDHLFALDGLRGMAILLVIGFHYFYINAAPFNKTDIYPYGDAFGDWPIFQYGILGVPLFFIISGFVIALTLDRCSSPIEFAVRRFARLWPALIFWSIITFLVLSLFDTPFSIRMAPKLADFIPSWSLTPTILWARVLPNIRFVDDVYWSLVVEIRFYVLAAIVYWSFKRTNFSRNFAIFTALVIFIRIAILKTFIPSYVGPVTIAFVPEHLPLFAAGAIFYEMYEGRIRRSLALPLLLLMYGFIVRLSLPDGFPKLATAAIVLGFFLTFFAVAERSKLLWILETRPLVFIGNCSYSIYLLHNYIGTTLISVIPKSVSFSIGVSLVLLIAVSMIGLGYLSFVYIERPLRKQIVAGLLEQPPTASAR